MMFDDHEKALDKRLDGLDIQSEEGLKEIIAYVSKKRMQQSKIKWKMLTDFILKEDKNLFRSALSSINRELYSKWHKRSNIMHQKERKKFNKSGTARITDIEEATPADTEIQSPCLRSMLICLILI
jgi:hypothetical protein